MKRIIFTLAALLVVGSLCAQPQAPITWGETELVMDLPDSMWVYNVAAHGDTIILSAISPSPPGNYSYATVAISGTDGRAWSPWHRFGFPESNDVWESIAVVTRQGILVEAQVNHDSSGLFRTTDLGQTWTAPLRSSYRSYLWPLNQTGDTVFLRETFSNATWTMDGGVHFSPPRPSGFTGEQNGIDDMANDGRRLHCVGVTRENSQTWPQLMYARAPLLEGSFEPVRQISQNVYFPMDAAIDLDEFGNGFIMLSACLHQPIPFPAAMLTYHTRDGGDSWQGPDTLSHGETADINSYDVVHEGALWIMVWYDLVAELPFQREGLWYSFSANHGRNWYPRHQIEGDSLYLGSLKFLELRGDRVRAYVITLGWHRPGSDRYQCHLRWEGHLRVDSLPPQIVPVQLPPDTVAVDHLLQFRAEVTDNDTIARVWMTIEQLDGNREVVEFNSQGNHQWTASWLVPHEGYYRYRIEAEDFWENSQSYPASGWNAFITEHGSAVNERGDQSGHAVDLRVYPNPTNGIVTIEGPGSFTEKPNELAVVNVLGQEVTSLHIPNTAFVHVQWGLTDLHGKALPAGLYFIIYPGGKLPKCTKLLIIK